MKNTFIVHILIYNVLCTIFSCSNHKYCFWDRGVLCLIIIFKKLQYVQRMDLKIQWTYITFWDSWFYKEIVEISLYTLIWCANLFIFSCCWLENIFKGVQCTYQGGTCFLNQISTLWYIVTFGLLKPLRRLDKKSIGKLGVLWLNLFCMVFDRRQNFWNVGTKQVLGAWPWDFKTLDPGQEQQRFIAAKVLEHHQLETP